MTEEPVATSTFSVSGLSTGMDTQSMIDKLVSLEQQPITALQTQQKAYQSQVSTLGGIASALSALQAATDALQSGNVLGEKAITANTAFTAAPSSSAAAGSYDVAVTSLASAAKWRSGAFASGDTLSAGTFTLSVNGASYPADGIAVTDGESLAQLASAINASGAPVTATVLNDGTSDYLSITATSTGYTGAASNAEIQVSLGTDARFDAGQQAWSQAARNAVFSVDGLQCTRQSNTVADAIPGTTLQLQKVSATDSGGVPIPETLTLATDTDATKAKLQTFVDAYNAVISLLQKQTDVSATTDRSSTLAGDPTVRNLQQALQSITASTVGSLGAGTVRSLADLGVKTARDGTLSIDTATFSAALARDPSAVNTLFSDPTSGIDEITSNLVHLYNAPVTGLLSIRQSGLNAQISAMTDQAAAMQARLDIYRQTLVDQFAAMETVVGQYKSIGTFLTQQSNQSSSSS
jgi:flagellar hook-associated protein 2